MLKRCLTLVCSVYVLSLLNISDAAAKICFLPDGDCGKTKITDVNSGKNGCIYKTKGEADAGKNDECEVSYQSQVNSCWWRRCNSDNKTIFDKLADCQKKIGDATKQECQACGSCYKLVTSTTPLPDNCPSGYSTKYQSPSDCGANESFSENGTYNGLVCGACTKTETCPSGYSTQYQSQSDCPTGETFSSSGMINDKVCGKCEKNETCPTGYSTQYQSQSDCPTGETFSSSGSVGNLTCGKCEKKNLTCNEISSSYYSVSNTAKYTECDQDNDIYDMYDINVTGSDGKCFYCHHRTCAEIADYVEAGEQWYTSCKANETAEKVPYLPGADGQCYTCKKTSDMLCNQINSNYININDNWECPNPKEYDYSVFETIETSVYGSDGKCYQCKHLTCREIDSDYKNDDTSCQRGYDSQKVLGYVGSDGQCYECKKQLTEVVMKFYRDQAESAGDYCEDGKYCSSYSCGSTYYCNSSICETRHKSVWDMHLDINQSAEDFNANNFVLPFEMKIVVTYKVPYVYRGNDCQSKPTTNWTAQDSMYEPRTVTMTFPKGTKYGAHSQITVTDYAGGIAPQTIEYYINGVKKSSYTDSANSIKYTFEEI